MRPFRSRTFENSKDHGVVLGNIRLPKDSFPNDNRKTDITFRNLDTKQEYNYLRTDGPFVMKLPPGKYVLADFWDGGTCQTSTAIAVGGVILRVPLDLSSLRKKLKRLIKRH